MPQKWELRGDIPIYQVAGHVKLFTFPAMKRQLQLQNRAKILILRLKKTPGSIRGFEVMSLLHRAGVTSSTNGTAASRLFESLFPNFLEVQAKTAHGYVDIVWQEYNKAKTNDNLNGAFFELVLATSFVREGLYPLFMQAEVNFVANAIFDLLLITQDIRPIGISAKTSLRERYKQAALEAMALKDVHRRAENYLLTLDVAEATRVKRKISSGEVVALDGVVVADQEEYSDLVAQLKKYTYIEIPTISVAKANQAITIDKIMKLKRSPNQ